MVANEVMEMIDDIRHEKDDVNEKIDVLEGKFESMRTDQVTKKQLEKERREADTKVDDVVKARLDETLQEENEKKLRKNNVIVFGLEESSASEGEVRNADDTEAMQMFREQRDLMEK